MKCVCFYSTSSAAIRRGMLHHLLRLSYPSLFFPFLVSPAVSPLQKSLPHKRREASEQIYMSAPIITQPVPATKKKKGHIRLSIHNRNKTRRERVQQKDTKRGNRRERRLTRAMHRGHPPPAGVASTLPPFTSMPAIVENDPATVEKNAAKARQAASQKQSARAGQMYAAKSMLNGCQSVASANPGY